MNHDREHLYSYPIGSSVYHTEGFVKGTLIKHLKPSVGAPYMAKVIWDTGSKSNVNERGLRQVAN